MALFSLLERLSVALLDFIVVRSRGCWLLMSSLCMSSSFQVFESGAVGYLLLPLDNRANWPRGARKVRFA